MYGLHVDSRKSLKDLETLHQQEPVKEEKKSKERPPLLLEPLFVILAGAAAAVVSNYIDVIVYRHLADQWTTGLSSYWASSI